MRFGFLLKRGKPEAREIAAELGQVLRQQGCRLFALDEDVAALPAGASTVSPEQLGSSIDALAVLGGDGTFLYGAGLVADHGVPLFGVNLGSLGFMTQFGRSEAPFNCVPVDFIVDAMAATADDTEAIGATLHLVDPDPVTAAEVARIFSMEYAGKPPQLRMPPRLIENSLRFKPIRDLYGGAPGESIRYLNHPVRFDTREADVILARNGLRCPRLEDYVEPIVRFFKEHEQDQALMPN